MAWDKKVAEVVAILNNIKRNQEFANVHTNVLVTPRVNFDLDGKLSPLTRGFEKERAIDYGILMLIQAKYDRTANRVLNDISISLRNKALTVKGGGNILQIATNLAIFGNMLNQEANRIKAFKEPTPEIIKIFDVLIMQSIASIPVIGPAAAGISGVTLSLAYQGLMLAIEAAVNRKKADFEKLGAAAALTVGGGVLANRAGENKVAQDYGKALGKAGDVKVPGIIEFIYTIYNDSQDSKREEAGDRLRGDPTKLNAGLLQFPNPNNQGVAAGNQLARGFVDNCASKEMADRIAKSADTQSKNCAEFFDNFGEMALTLRRFFETATNDAVVASFNPLLLSMRQRIDALRSMQPPAKGLAELEQVLLTFTQNEDLIAAVIAGWYLKNGIDANTKRVLESAYPWVRGPGPRVNASNAVIQQKIRGLLRKGDIKEKDLTEAKVFSEAQFQNVGRQVGEYVDQIKEAVADTLDAVFTVTPTPAELGKIISLHITCTNIVAECYKRAEANQDLEINETYIRELESLRYVKTYTKAFIVTDSKKRELTRTVESGVETWTLRYPLGKGSVFGSASVNEAAMVFAFAVLVTQYVDLLRIAAGLDNLNAVKENLNRLIGQINKAANIGLYT